MRRANSKLLNYCLFSLMASLKESDPMPPYKKLVSLHHYAPSLLALLTLIVLGAVSAPAAATGAPIFINEIHYNNTGADQNEVIEIAGPAGANIVGYTLTVYNAAGAMGSGFALGCAPANRVYTSCTFPDQQGGMGTIRFFTGSLDDTKAGFALTDPQGKVFQFINYGTGTITATNGPANGLTSTNIGVTEDESTAAGDSLQLTGGPGEGYGDFTWSGPTPNTRGGTAYTQRSESYGAVNTGQTFSVTDVTTYQVTSAADTDDLVCDANCTLREAIRAANFNPGAETITFAAGLTGPINLTQELPNLASDMTISGPGANSLTIEKDPVLPATTELRIFNVEVQVQEGAVFFRPTVTISGLTLSGGFHNTRYFIRNPANNLPGSGSGGGIFNQADLTLRNVVVSGNSGGEFGGGGVMNYGEKIDNFFQIPDADPNNDLTNVVLNPAPTVTVIRSTFTLNHTNPAAGGDGGGIYNYKGTVNVVNSTLNDNYVDDPDGFGMNGGGIINRGGTVNVLNSTLSHNTSTSSGGGIYNGSGSSALAPALVAGALNILNSTFTLNENNDGGIGLGGGGISNSEGGGNTLNLGNTIVAGNTDLDGLPDIAGTVTSQGHNLIGDTTGGSGYVASDLQNQDAKLQGLANNGGPTKTHAILAAPPANASPAIDAGNNALLPATDDFDLDGDAVTAESLPVDQRGFLRVSNSIVDIGAFEADVTPPTVLSIVRVGANPTNAASVDFTVTFDEAVTGVDTGDFSLTTSGVSGTGVSNVSGSGTTYTVTVSTGTGNGTIRLDVADNDTVQDASGNSLGGTGTGNGNFTVGEVYTIDRTAPTVLSITRLDPSPTRDSFVRYTVVFSEPVSGVADDDFTLTKTGTLTGEAVSGVTGGGDTYTVGVDTGTGGGGNGTLRLNLADDDSITDAAGNMLGGTGTGNGNFTAGETYVIPPVVQSGQVLISEFRARGPQGEADEYVELYNNTDTNITVLSTDSSSGWSLAASDGAIRATLPNGFVFPARSHYLVANGNGYSLGSVAPEDDDFFTDLPTSNLGLALFSTSNAGSFTLSNRLDAVGYDDEPSGLYREGNGFSTGNAEMTQDLEYAFVRNLASGNPADTDNNLTDFLPVETSLSGTTALGEKLGSPGPEAIVSPITHNETSYLQVGLIDTGASSSVSPNRDRDVNDPLGTNGTLSINRTLTNTSGQTLSAVRLRVAAITTAPLVAGRADLRVKGVKVQRSSPLLPWSDPSVTLRNVDQPFDPSLGGGLNSTLTVVDTDTPMLPGDVIAISIVLGVETPGSFKFAANFEALPAP
jgi:CSLREA domain-containing protein